MCRLLKFWSPIICSLWGILSVGVAEASSGIRLYSALAEPVVAALPLSSVELAAASIRLQGGGYHWRLLPAPWEGQQLLLSQEPVGEPIVELTLSADGSSRPVTLLLTPVAPHARSELLQAWAAQQQQLQAQNGRLQQQLEQVAQQLAQHDRQPWLPQAVLSRWLLFLLLGAGVAWWLARWWRAAEWVALADHSVAPDNTDAAHRFQQGVVQIEREILPPASAGGGR